MSLLVESDGSIAPPPPQAHCKKREWWIFLASFILVPYSASQEVRYG